MVPRMEAQPLIRSKLRASIQTNIEFIATHRTQMACQCDPCIMWTTSAFLFKSFQETAGVFHRISRRLLRQCCEQREEALSYG